MYITLLFLLLLFVFFVFDFIAWRTGFTPTMSQFLSEKVRSSKAWRYGVAIVLSGTAIFLMIHFDVFKSDKPMTRPCAPCKPCPPDSKEPLPKECL